MKRELISKALSEIDDRYIIESMGIPKTLCEGVGMIVRQPRKNTAAPIRSRSVMRLALAACLIFALAVSAYAVHYYLGIRDMDKELPDTVDPYIQQHTEAAVVEDWSARVTESLCDANKVLVTVTVSGGDKYIVAPTDADPDTLVSNIGIPGNQTLGEYAREQGKQLLFVGASLQENEALGGNGSQSFRNISNSEMTILITADKKAEWSENEIICHVYAVDEEWSKLTLDIPFRLTEVPAEDGTYVPDDPDTIPGFTVGNATVTETPAGISIRYMVNVTDEDAWYNNKKVEFDGLVYGEGGTVLEDDGNWWFTVSRCTGTVGNALTARYYDWDDQLIGTITFTSKS